MKKVGIVMGSDSDPFYGAPCVIVVFADPSIHTYLEDGSLVMGNMLNTLLYYKNALKSTFEICRKQILLRIYKIFIFC